MSTGTGKCNCSICTKAREWAALIKPGDFRLVQGQEALSNYQFGGKQAHHLFCKHCGVRSFGKGCVEKIGGDYVAVYLSTLDNVTPQELIDAPIRYFDGRNDNGFATPAETRHL
ncbi:GFA family protein [Microbulbifer magnicolonia]|uniref:GFA family protein n=1 Tax=Microbulbifer magnicolonia TaxID=3109744 RepID=UPI002B40EFFB|nr:GFA family protein [Microbulbifer sp. GG15]